MVKIKKISKPELTPIIAFTYEGDNDLFDKYHPAKSDKFGSIESTVEMIEDISKQYKCSFYKVMLGDKIIGYFVTWKEFLYSFAINIHYRKKEILIAYWQKIKDVLGRRFQTMLYTENSRAIAFLLRNGMKINKQEKNVVTLINT